MTRNNNCTIVLVPHYLSVDVYADLALEINKCSEYETCLLVLSEEDKKLAISRGMTEDNVVSYEKKYSQGELDKFGLNELADRFPNVPWGTVVAAERSFTDYSFTFGGVGGRSEKNDYIVPFLLRLICFFDAEYARTKPYAVITVFGDNIYTHTASIIAEEKGIKFLLPHASYLNEIDKPECGYLGNTRFLESFAMVRNYLEYKKRDLTPKERERAEKFSRTLLLYDGKKTLEKIYKKKDFESPVTPNLKNILGYIRHHFVMDRNIYFYKIDIFKKIKANLLRYIRIRLTKNFLKKSSNTLPQKVVFFPMHYQPEASTLINGIWYANQITLIESLSKALPLGYTLIVKEHPRGRGMRPLWQYKHIASLFNVELCELPSKIILERAEAVVTISGSIGLEALAMRKPVLMLGRTFHSFNTVYFRADSMEQMSYTLKCILLDKAFEKIPNLDDEINKSLLAYVDSLYDFFPFGEKRKSLAGVVLEELEKPTKMATEWISSRATSSKFYHPQ
jgi:hypothetical protein